MPGAAANATDDPVLRQIGSLPTKLFDGFGSVAIGADGVHTEHLDPVDELGG
jgi:hypothetical protein